MAGKTFVIDPSKVIFALDVGTRTVVGIACYPEGEKLRVLDIQILEHPQRNMIDGQIHNVEGVIQTVLAVKEALEERLQLKFSRVSVAAAGRSLKTRQVLVEREISPDYRIIAEEVSSLELEGAQTAQKELARENSGEKDLFFCIGYSTVYYLLDGHPITSLISQKGHTMGAMVLATFLPSVVVDNLLTVIEQARLSLHSLTLEPIAAIQALIPPEHRLLNLALIDMGAGTTDIAITNRGSVMAYAMVPLAGDEITEALADHFLLDFKTAENLKLQLTAKKPRYKCKDIIGNVVQANPEKILEVIDPVLDEITGNIVKAILHYNQKPPRALFCVGGGSRTPLLREKLSQKMGLPLERVSIRDFKTLNRMVYPGRKLKGPEAVTPMGIALSALGEKFFGFSYITVNDKVIRLLETEETRVGKALIAAGFNPRSLVGLRGASLKINVNGEERYFPGKTGENAEIWVNGKSASLETVVHPHDNITVKTAVPGEDATLTVQDLLGKRGSEEISYVYLKGSRVYLPPLVTVNEKTVSYDRTLQNNDRVEIKHPSCTLEELGLISEIDFRDLNVKINEKKADLSCRLQAGDNVDWD